MRVIIEDLVAKHSGKKEKVLPEDTVIRFEFDKSNYITIKNTERGLEVYKIGQPVAIEIRPNATNVIYIK